ETINAANRLYYDSAHDFTSLQHTGKSAVPAAIARFPKDILPAPREWAERWFYVQRWTAMPRGGHFAAMEENPNCWSRTCERSSMLSKRKTSQVTVERVCFLSNIARYNRTELDETTFAKSCHVIYS